MRGCKQLVHPDDRFRQEILSPQNEHRFIGSHFWYVQFTIFASQSHGKSPFWVYCFLLMMEKQLMILFPLVVGIASQSAYHRSSLSFPLFHIIFDLTTVSDIKTIAGRAEWSLP